MTTNLRCTTNEPDAILDMLAPVVPRICAHTHFESVERGALCWPVAGAERATLEHANRIPHRAVTFEPTSGGIAIVAKAGTVRFFGLTVEGASDDTVRVAVSAAVAVQIARRCIAG